MKRQILISLILLSSVLTMNAQTWSGSTPGNIYYNQGNVTIGASTSNTANLHIGKQEAPANTAGEVLRLSLQPYGHLGGPWIFKTRDIPGVAFLDILYGTGTAMTINSSSNIGIGTTAPSFRFHIRGGNANSDLMTLGTATTGNFALTSADGGAYGLFGGVSNSGRAWLQAGRYDTNTAYDLILQASGGNIGIGTTSPGYKLDVIGTIRAREIKVDLNGADFVFEKDYKLMPLKELEKFVKEQKHLPEITPAKEMKENGTDLGNLNSKLLQKMEEMTLYIIEQNKELQLLKEKIAKLEKATNP